MVALSPLARKVLLGHGAMSEIARRYGVTPQHVSQVVQGKARSRKIQRAVARKLGRKLHETFSAEELGQHTPNPDDLDSITEAA